MSTATIILLETTTVAPHGWTPGVIFLFMMAIIGSALFAVGMWKGGL